MLLKAKDVADKLLLDFRSLGSLTPAKDSLDVLEAALSIVQRRSISDENGHSLVCQRMEASSNVCAPTMLAHPDEFKNPSSFLRVYGSGSMLADLKASNAPITIATWKCHKCSQTDIPGDECRCFKCDATRDVSAEEAVLGNAAAIYQLHLKAYKQHLQIRRIKPSRQT